MSSWLETLNAGASARVAQSRNPAAKRGAQLLSESAWPTRKTEAWKYTSLSSLAEASYDEGKSTRVAPQAIANFDAFDLVFDGVRWRLPDIFEEGVRIATFDNLSPLEQSEISAEMLAIKPARHLFGAVNDLMAQDILVIDVEPNAAPKIPLRVVLNAIEGGAQHARIWVRIASGAKLQIIEQVEGSGQGLSTLFAEYSVADTASLCHSRFQLQGGEHHSIGGCHIKLGEHAKLRSTVVGFGSQVSRLDFDVEHAGGYAHAEIDAVYLLQGEELFDLHSTIEHAVANGTTDENVRGIVADRAKAVFNGRIHIHRDAQKTLAELNNRNLLLSSTARVSTKPELEIYADDVKCAHGATVAELDDAAIYYLRSRGVSEHDAKVMLNFGFINELVDKMPNFAVAEWLRGKLKARFLAMNEG